MQTGILLMLLSMPSVASCTCADARSVAEELKSADAVFTGRVESVKPVDPEKPHGRIAITFAVWRGYKRVKESSIVLKGWAHSTCSFPFQARKLYMVYAFQTAAKEFVSHNCSRTRLIQEAGEDLQQLPEPIFVQEE